MKILKKNLMIPIFLILALTVIPVFISIIALHNDNASFFPMGGINENQDLTIRDSSTDLNVEVNMVQEGDKINVNVEITNNNPNIVSNVELTEVWDSAAFFTASAFNKTQWNTIDPSESVYASAEINLLEKSSTPLDFAITIDASGSMSQEIDAVQDSLIEVLNILRTKSSVRTGISIFGWDYSHGYNPYLTPEKLTIPLTENITDVVDFVNTLYASGADEPLGDSFYQMNRNWEWRSDAQKIVVIIGDEPDNAGTMVDDYSGTYTLQEEAEYTSLQNIQVIGVHSDDYYPDSDAKDDQQVFVNETEGLYRYFDSDLDEMPAYIMNGIDQLKNSLPITLKLNISYDYDGSEYRDSINNNYYIDSNSESYIGEPSITFSGSLPTDINVETEIYDQDGINEAKLQYRYGDVLGESINWGSWSNASMSGDNYNQYSLNPHLSYNTQNTFVFQFEIIAIDGQGDITTKSDFCKPYWTVEPNVTDNAPNIIEILRSPENITENDEIIINASINDDFGVNSAKIIYRIDEGSWQEYAMSLIDGTSTSGIWEFNFGTLSGGKTVEYYIETYDTLYQKTKDDNNGLKYIFKVRGEGGEEDYSFPSILNLQHTPENPSINDDIEVELNLTDNIDIKQDSVKLYWTRDSSFSNPTEVNLTYINNGTTEDNQPWYVYTHIIPSSGTDEDIYYKIIAEDTAFNEIESTIKTINIDIPDSSILSSNADSPDTDGSFTLNWTPSDGVDNYALYTYDSPINEINNSLTLIEDEMLGLSKPLSGIEVGTHYYTIVASNSTGYSLSNCLEIIVTDESAPSIDHPDDIIVSEGYSTQAIKWSVSDAYPATYSIQCNESEVVSEEVWSNGNITFDIPEGKTKGTYTYTIIIEDESGNNASDTVELTIADESTPSITSPDDIIISEGYSTQSITWEANDAHPTIYSIQCNESEVVSEEAWSNGNITFDIPEGKTKGTYTYTIIIEDESGNSVSDTVELTVNKDNRENLMDIIRTYSYYFKDYENESNFFPLALIITLSVLGTGGYALYRKSKN
jgi:C4-type Zn-finger protein